MLLVVWGIKHVSLSSVKKMHHVEIKSVSMFAYNSDNSLDQDKEIKS